MSLPEIRWYATRLPELITQTKTSGRESCGCKKDFFQFIVLRSIVL